MAESIGLKINDPAFWQPDALRAEVDRVFDVCHSCRLCFKFCGSFPAIFDAIDQRTEANRDAYLAAHPEIVEAANAKRAAAEAAGPVVRDEHLESAEGFGDELPELTAHAHDLDGVEIDHAVDLCFQCKLCYPACPYTPPHEWAIDFPRLLLRWKAHRVREHGVPMTTRLTRNPTVIGKIGSLAPALANAAMRAKPNRVLMEKTVGIHRDKRMPTFHAETFPRWLSGRGTSRVEPSQPLKDGVEEATPLAVALFSTCVVDFHNPATGKAAVEVLEHLGVEVTRPPEQVCCGMPFLDGGDVEAAAANARKNLAALEPWVARGHRVVIPSPSCSLMIREEYPQLVPGTAADRVAAASHDLMEYLYRIAREGRLKRDFQRRHASLRYHVPCHVRVQNIGLRGRDILKVVSDEVVAVQECTGHDGTWSMRREHFADSLRWGAKAFEGMGAAVGESCGGACSDCGLAALHLKQGANVDAVHPVVALAWAYGFDVGEAGNGFVEKPPA